MERNDKVIAISGSHKARTGIFIKSCSTAFNDYCRIKLDLKGRERENKIVMVLKSDIQSN
jgi:hypothetical protein